MCLKFPVAPPQIYSDICRRNLFTRSYHTSHVGEDFKWTSNLLEKDTDSSEASVETGSWVSQRATLSGCLLCFFSLMGKACEKSNRLTAVLQSCEGLLPVLHHTWFGQPLDPDLSHTCCAWADRAVAALPGIGCLSAPNTKLQIWQGVSAQGHFQGSYLFVCREIVDAESHQL